MYKPDTKLISNHGTDGSYRKWKQRNRIDLESPYCLLYSDSRKQLYYIGAKHTTDMNSQTYKLIKYIITTYKPEIVILEGVDYADGVNPALRDFDGEGNYAKNIAAASGISYIGIESSDKDAILEISKTYKIDDIYGYRFMRMYKYYFRSKRATRGEFIADFYEYEYPYLSSILGNINFDPIRWFKRRFNKDFRYGRYLEYASPYIGNGSVITQRISYRLSRIRDINNIRTLYHLINKYNKLLLIMGENHLYADRKILSNTFAQQILRINLTS